MSFKTIQTKLAQIRNREEGVTALEYALIAALIAVVIVGSVTTVGTGARTSFTTVSGAINN